VDAHQYQRLAAAEDSGWWFRALHANLLAALPAGKDAPKRLLDAGCGTGGLLARLARALPGAALFGIELDREAAALARRKSGAAVCRGTVDLLPFGEGAFDAVLSADVLCHRGVDAERALKQFRRCLKRGGLVVLNLPAYRWLYSGHDLAVDNARRYARHEVSELLAAAGFERVRTRYWNTFLFPLMLLRRKLWRSGGGDVELLPAPLERAFGAATALESRLLKAGIFLPFGGSILATAMKP
jgi:SAM-dependent methyltransferase